MRFLFNLIPIFAVLNYNIILINTITNCDSIPKIYFTYLYHLSVKIPINIISRKYYSYIVPFLNYNFFLRNIVPFVISFQTNISPKNTELQKLPAH